MTPKYRIKIYAHDGDVCEVLTDYYTYGRFREGGGRDLYFHDEQGQSVRVVIDKIEAHVLDRFRTRRPFLRGKTERLLGMAVGETMVVEYIRRNNYGGWQSIASKLGKLLGCYWRMESSKGNDTITITRMK